MGKISSLVSLNSMSELCKLSLAVTLLVLAACATSPPAPIVDRTRTGDVTAVVSSPTSPIRPLASAVVDIAQANDAQQLYEFDESREQVVDSSVKATTIMLASVDAELAAQNFSAAEGIIERAIQISPSDSWAWHKLAKLRFAERRYALAKAIARRSNSLSDAGRAVRIANLRLIADIEYAHGNETAAREAQGQADEISAARENDMRKN
jgi:hypothetical protein